MAIFYFVQSFRKNGRKLVADPPQAAKSPEAAKATAERLAQRKEGVIAYSQSIDVETDSYDDPVLLFRSGTVPSEFDD